MSTAAVQTDTITREELTKFAADWYRKLDVHAPQAELQPMLTPEGLVMKFPEVTARGLGDFSDWYEKVTRIFFDEVHTVKEVTPTTITGSRADVHVVVEWQASVWSPPKPTSARIVLDADQSWTVERSPSTGALQISSYTVNSLSYHANSAKL